MAARLVNDFKWEFIWCTPFASFSVRTMTIDGCGISHCVLSVTPGLDEPLTQCLFPFGFLSSFVDASGIVVLDKMPFSLQFNVVSTHDTLMPWNAITVEFVK